MPDAAFVSFAELFRPPLEPAPTPVEHAPEATSVSEEEIALPDVRETIRAARRFRAAIADALDARLEDLLRDLASDVLARELALAPVDIATLVQRVIAERRADAPVCVHVAPDDANVVCALPLVVDASLRAGDAVLVCAQGTIDVRLGVRLADVLEHRA